jgi:hypothetical protein
MNDELKSLITKRSEQTKGAFEAYTLALGKVAHAWNYLHEQLGQLFIVVSGAEGQIALAIWYSTNSDRTQREMLRAAVAATGADRWKALPKAQEHLKWLLNHADTLAEERNNAIHAPAALYISESPEMGPSFFYGNPRAQKLMGKKLLIEFDWCERYAETLSQFAQKIATAIAFPADYPWPEKPSVPTRRADLVARS